MQSCLTFTKRFEDFLFYRKGLYPTSIKYYAKKKFGNVLNVQEVTATVLLKKKYLLTNK